MSITHHVRIAVFSLIGTSLCPARPSRSPPRSAFSPTRIRKAAAWSSPWTLVRSGFSHPQSCVAAGIFLTLDVFKRADHPLGWLPLANKGTLGMASEYTFPQVYPKDEWVKRHPLFEGLPCGGLMDSTFYREIIPDLRYWGQASPEEPVAGAFRTSCPGHHSELMLSVYGLGSGRFILNSLRVRQALGQDPAAERLLRNMLRYAARDVTHSPVRLPVPVEEHLKALGYE